MAKQVSINMFKDEVSAYDEFIEIPVTIGDNSDEYAIKVFPFFKPELVRSMVEDLITFFQNAAKENLTIPQHEEDDLVGFFIVKHFTDLKFTKSKKAKKIYEEFKIAVNTKVFKIIIKTFPEDSIREVYERIDEIKEANVRLQSMIAAKQKEIQELPLENRELFEQLSEQHNVRNVLADKTH